MGGNTSQLPPPLPNFPYFSLTFRTANKIKLIDCDDQCLALIQQVLAASWPCKYVDLANENVSFSWHSVAILRTWGIQHQVKWESFFKGEWQGVGVGEQAVVLCATDRAAFDRMGAVCEQRFKLHHCLDDLVFPKKPFSNQQAVAGRRGHRVPQPEFVQQAAAVQRA